MNFIEKYISEFLRSYPRIRKIFKLVYQYVNYNLSKITNFEKKNLKEKKIFSENSEVFFGYYDKSPWNDKNNFLLSLEVPCSNTFNKNDRIASIILVDSNKYTKEKIANTRTWNMQQGSMVQWLGPDFDKKIIYNDMLENEYVSIIYNIQTDQKKIIHKPIYSVNKSGEFALSLNFSRLQRLRPGYGYSFLNDMSKGKKYPENDGIWLVDLKNDVSKLIISLEKLVNIKWEDSMAYSEHRINHLDFSPNSKRFSFIHRWEYKNETYSRLLTANRDGTDIYVLADDKMVSHTCWKNNNQLLAWARQKEYGDHYYLFSDKTNIKKIIGKNILRRDGHPSYSPNKRYILTDTYPDRKRYRNLIIYDTYKKKKYILGKYFATFKYIGEKRCDLHPRWSRNGKHICFDSVHEGKRQLYVIENVVDKLEEV